MARRLYVNQPTYFHWENGDSIPHLEVIKTLASMFGTSLDYLCDFKPTLKPEDSYQQALFRLREMKVEFEDEEKLADLISDDELNADYIIPKAFDKRVGPAVAAAVAEAARRSGVARI